MQCGCTDQRILAHAETAGDGLSRRGVRDWIAARLLLQGIELVKGLVELLDLGLESGTRIDGDQRTTDPLLAVFAVDRKPRNLERVGDLIRSVVSVCRKCRDAVHLLLLDAPERLVDGDEQFIGMIGC